MDADRRKQLAEKLFTISSEGEFEEVAMEVFFMQARYNEVYKKYIGLMGVSPSSISGVDEIPCLPVSLFRTQKILTSKSPAELVFRSSGTGGGIPALHYVADRGLYRRSLLKCFRLFYGDPSGYCILALLPSYLERGDSSLVFMVQTLIREGAHPESGFYLNDFGGLVSVLRRMESAGEKVLLIGVSFALLDLAEKHPLSLKNTIVMETGGMKGRRRELVREELHSVLRRGLAVGDVHSEYGMTELLSQAYSRSGGRFRSPPWMKVMIRDTRDPFTWLPAGRSGGVSIIDLANIDSCSFLETADLGRILPGGEFEILGRFDNSDIRGCNLLAE